jgi:Protein of unknown function (DUF1570)
VTGGAHVEPARRLLDWVATATLLLAASTIGCASITDRGQPLVPTRYQHRTGQFVILSNFAMADDPPAVRCLVALERDMKEHLGFEPRDDHEPVEIYVLDSRNAFAHFLKFYYPDLPPRRAFFLAQGQQRVVYTYSSSRLEEDLRHEATHALLHGSFGDLPLWLDEGLAEYFEDDLAQPGVEHDRIVQINKDLSTGWVPSLSRLESLTDIREMTPRDYREAWAWVHLLLNNAEPGNPRLLAALSESTAVPARLKFSSQGVTNEQLLSHLKTLPSRMIAGEPDPAARAVRLQDRPVETPPTAPSGAPRGILQRLRAFFGL